MTETKINRKFKDSVFTLLFSEKSNLLELYNAISGKNYPESTEIKIITLSNALFMEKINDICFVIDGKLVVLVEHQSSINENMCLRMLIYIAREYEKITNSRDLYREKMIKIPTPEFIVLYNGKDEFPDYKEMKLSDSFEIKNDTCFLELVAKVYNINKGRNADIANRSPVLSGYEEFIAEIKSNLDSMNLAEAIRAAIKTCLSKNILLYFLREHGSEVENMLFTEWNWDDALAVAREEAREEGRDEGIVEGIGIGEERGVAIGRNMERKELFALWESGVSLAEAKELLREQK
jgi:predicted transposase/invertase (TIGR01784 family)